MDRPRRFLAKRTGHELSPRRPAPIRFTKEIAWKGYLTGSSSAMSRGGSTKPANALVVEKATTSAVTGADAITTAAANHRNVVAALRGGHGVPFFSYQGIRPAHVRRALHSTAFRVELRDKKSAFVECGNNSSHILRRRRSRVFPRYIRCIGEIDSRSDGNSAGHTSPNSVSSAVFRSEFRQSHL